MDGQNKILNSLISQGFVDSLISWSESYTPSSLSSYKFRIGSASAELLIGIDGIYGDYLSQAFIKGEEQETPEYEILVVQDDRFWYSEDCQGLRGILRTQLEVEYKACKFFIAHNPYEEMIFIFDLARSRITILIGPEEARNLACFVTPFRIVIDWIAQQKGAFAIHASVIARDDLGFILNGPSGSGKSTMAALAIKNNLNVIADDVAIIESNLVSAVYRHAKLDRSMAKELFSKDYFFELPFQSQGKVIIDLTALENIFRPKAGLGALVFPRVTGRNCVADISSVSALRSMAPNVMREVIGGTTEALSFMSLLVRKVSSFELELSHDADKGFQDLTDLMNRRNAPNGGK